MVCACNDGIGGIGAVSDLPLSEPRFGNAPSFGADSSSEIFVRYQLVYRRCEFIPSVTHENVMAIIKLQSLAAERSRYQCLAAGQRFQYFDVRSGRDGQRGYYDEGLRVVRPQVFAKALDPNARVKLHRSSLPHEPLPVLLGFRTRDHAEYRIFVTAPDEGHNRC